jgi:hypothetical protein
MLSIEEEEQELTVLVLTGKPQTIMYAGVAVRLKNYHPVPLKRQMEQALVGTAPTYPRTVREMSKALIALEDEQLIGTFRIGSGPVSYFPKIPGHRIHND